MLRRLSRSQFNRRLHRVSHLFQELFERLADYWGQSGDEDIFLVDSFPVSVCDNIRIDECQIYPTDATEDVFRGYIASKKRFFLRSEDTRFDQRRRPTSRSVFQAR